MAVISPSERITESFYAWELRGRGWQLADYPVSLEPPYRPFFLIDGAGSPPEVLDDGKRPTLFSALGEGFTRLFARAEQAPLTEPFEEQAPFPAINLGSLLTFRLVIPADYKAHTDIALALLTALSASYGSVSFELVGHGGKVELQIACAALDRDHVVETILGYVPEANIIAADDVLAAHWNSAQPSAVVDAGLSQEFFLPFRTFSSLDIDPYIALIPALANTRDNELVVLQVLFERVQNPWGGAIRDALDDGDGGCLFVDAPEFLPGAKEKLATPLVAACIRMGANAGSEDAAWNLLRGTRTFFLQFGAPGGNELIPLANDEYPDHLHAAALLGRESFRTGAILSVEELVGLVHLPDCSVRHRALARVSRQTKECPSAATGHRYILGENVHRGVRTLVSLSEQVRMEHTWIIGGSGTGKSTLLLNLIGTDIANGEGLAVLDPHGDLIEDILARIPEERIDDVIVFDPADTEYPIGFNILSAGSDIEKHLLASDVVGMFARLSTSWGDTMTTVLANAVLAILESTEGGTLLELRRFLIDERFRKTYLATISDPHIRLFWEKEYPLIGTRSVGPILSRLDAFLRPKLIRHIVGQKNAPLDVADVMENGKILLAKLSQGLIGEENAALLGSLLVSKFHQTALARQALRHEDRHPFYLYADEFQHFVTPSMEGLLTGARKYRLGLTLAHQTLAQVKDAPAITSALFGNAHTRIVFRVGDDDARKLAEGFASFNEEDIQQLPRGEAIVRLGGKGNDCNIQTFPREAVDAETAAKRRIAVLARSREQYATALSELRFEVEQVVTPEVKADEISIVGTPPPPPTAGLALPPQQIPQPAKRSTRIMPDEPATLGRGGQEHKYLQHLIKRLAEERGFRAIIEDAASDGRADVVLKKDAFTVGCEISITTSVEHEIANLTKCLASGFTRILFVSPDRKRREKVAGWAKEHSAKTPIDIVSPEEIVHALDQLDAGPASSETIVRGYKVKVTRQTITPADVAGRRAAIAQVIARSMGKT